MARTALRRAQDERVFMLPILPYPLVVGSSNHGDGHPIILGWWFQRLHLDFAILNGDTLYYELS